MPLFGRGNRYPSRKQLRVADSWQLAEGTCDGKPIITRFNRFFDKVMGHPEFAHQVGIAAPLRNPLPDGFPTPEEGAVLQGVEDDLTRVLGRENVTLLVGVITTSGMREFVFYTSSPETVKKQFEELRNTKTGHKLQLMIQPDPEWTTYRTFAAVD
jgi:hypothetical protein